MPPKSSNTTPGAAKTLADTIIYLSTFLISLLTLFVLFLIGYVIYKMYTSRYPRTFGLGHSENYEDFMPEYVAEVLTTINMCAQDPEMPSGVQQACATFLALKGKSATPLKDKSLFGEVKFGEPQNLEQPISSSLCTLQQMPALYMYFIFKESILEDGGEGDSELVLYKKFFEDNPYALGIETNANRSKIKSNLKQDMQQINKAFMSLTSTINLLGDQAPPLAYKLLLLVSYLPDIFKAYDFRKSGGPGNMKMFKLLMRDYVEYVWVDMIPSIWKNFVSDYKDLAKRLVDWFTGPTVSNYMQNLPATIAGIKKEKFEDSPLSIMRPPPHTKPGDTVETFGFLKPLIQLPKFFMLLIDVAKALATAVSNPLKAFKIIIGLVVGTFLYIAYSIIAVFTAIFMVPAFLYIVAYKIYLSAWWVLMFIIIAFIYVILWLLDYATGGAILPLFRCENLPSKWFAQPGFWFGNKYVKGIFCSGPCSKSFLPSTPGTTWCDRKDRQQPAYCPQQLIYQYYNALLTQAPPASDTIKSHPIYAFKPDPTFYTKPEEIQKSIVDEFVQRKFKYLSSCYKSARDYKKVQSISTLDKYNNREKFWPRKDVYNAFSLSVCDQLQDLEKRYGKDSEYLRVLKQVCRETYCKYNYDKDFPILLDEECNGQTYNFCKQDPETSIDESKYTMDPEDSSTLIKFAIALVLLTITISVVSIIYANTSEKLLDYSTTTFKFDAFRQLAETIKSHKGG